MLTIRLARRGRKKQPFYDLVLAEKARAVQKRYVKKLGYYNPLSEEGKGELIFDKPATETAIKNGAQPSQAVARLLTKAGITSAGKFVIARSSKPKKEEAKEEKSSESEES